MLVVTNSDNLSREKNVECSQKALIEISKNSPAKAKNPTRRQVFKPLLVLAALVGLAGLFFTNFLAFFNLKLFDYSSTL